MKPETGDEMIHLDSLPPCFNLFQILRGNLGQIQVESHNVSHEAPVEPMPPLSKIFYDPIVDIMDNVCFQSQFSFIPNVFKNCYDMDMIRQSATGVCLAEASFQNTSEKL